MSEGITVLPLPWTQEIDGGDVDRASEGESSRALSAVHRRQLGDRGSFPRPKSDEAGHPFAEHMGIALPVVYCPACIKQGEHDCPHDWDEFGICEHCHALGRGMERTTDAPDQRPSVPGTWDKGRLHQRVALYSCACGYKFVVTDDGLASWGAKPEKYWLPSPRDIRERLIVTRRFHMARACPFDKSLRVVWVERTDGKRFGCHT